MENVIEVEVQLDRNEYVKFQTLFRGSATEYGEKLWH